MIKLSLGPLHFQYGPSTLGERVGASMDTVSGYNPLDAGTKAINSYTKYFENSLQAPRDANIIFETTFSPRNHHVQIVGPVEYQPYGKINFKKSDTSYNNDQLLLYLANCGFTCHFLDDDIKPHVKYLSSCIARNLPGLKYLHRDLIEHYLENYPPFTGSCVIACQTKEIGDFAVSVVKNKLEDLLSKQATGAK